MSFLHLHFKGRTSTPWHVGKMRYGDYLYTRRDYLWGRGIRGPVLRQLWRTYCNKSSASERTDFVPERDCSACGLAAGCPFNNLRGSDDDGEFKDRPRLIITNLRFAGQPEVGRAPLATLDDKYLTAVPGRAPVFVEYLREGLSFEFEAIMMGDGVRFSEEFESSVKVSLRFHGWGGFCNEGFGRGEITQVDRNDFEAFEERCLKPVAQNLVGRRGCGFAIEPLLMLDKDGGGYYRSVFEAGFREKLSNCLSERFWQFYGENRHLDLKEVGGVARAVTIQGWSRKGGSRVLFAGIGNEVHLNFADQLDEKYAMALALARYGIGRFKNQGFGSLKPKPQP